MHSLNTDRFTLVFTRYYQLFSINDEDITNCTATSVKLFQGAHYHSYSDYYYYYTTMQHIRVFIEKLRVKTFVIQCFNRELAPYLLQLV